MMLIDSEASIVAHGRSIEHPLNVILDHGKSVFSLTVDLLVREIHEFLPRHSMWDLLDWHDPPPLDQIEALLREKIAGFRAQREARNAALQVRRDALVRQIEAAFADVTLGSGISISLAHFIDDYGTTSMERDDDHKGHWSLVDIRSKDAQGIVFSFTDAEGFRFYIPAYIVENLRHDYPEIGDTKNSGAVDSIISTLDCDLAKSSGFFDILSQEQCRCIAEFLLFDYEISLGSDARDSLAALKHYWIKYLPPEVQEALS